MFACYSVAYELKMDIDVVLTWTPSKIKGWQTYFVVKNDLEHEAYEKARVKARQDAIHGIHR